MDVLLQAFAKINGVADYTAVNVGFNILPALTSGKVDAVMGPFKTYETVTMAAKGIEAAYFELEHWGIPDYDELIFICGAGTLAKKADAVQRFVRAVARGLEDARNRPEEALQAYFKAVPDVDQAIEKAAFERTRPYFAQTQNVDQKRWQAFADFASAYGLIERPVPRPVIQAPFPGPYSYIVQPYRQERQTCRFLLFPRRLLLRIRTVSRKGHILCILPGVRLRRHLPR